MIVKVCGLRAPENIAAVANVPGVDWIGLIFHPSSPRVMDRTAEQLARTAGLRPKGRTGERTVKRVGVFVNQPVEAVVTTAAVYGLDAVQLHGVETPAYCALLAACLPVIKAFRVNAEFDMAQTDAYAPYCRHFLFDAAGPAPGGNGTAFEWDQLASYSGKTPFLLAGGLHPESLADLDRFQHPAWAGIDLNSGFELAPGWKDVAALKTFVHGFREGHHQMVTQ